MIKRLKYNEIDFEKYDECLKNSVQKNFYAKREILDFLTKKSWELLVFKDYEAVMPIAVGKKIAIPYCYIPLFSQQLGIFSGMNKVEVNDLFLAKFLKEYHIQGYAFNSENKFSKNTLKKKNYIILKNDYQFIKQKYFKGRKSTVKSAQNLEFRSLEIGNNLLKFIVENNKGLKNKVEFRKLTNYIKFLDSGKQLRIFGSFKENELTNLALLIDTEEELMLLGLINNKKFDKDNGASFLLDRIIQENSSERNINFMGGSIRGLEVFFKSFGAENFEYAYFLISNKGFVKNIFFKNKRF